MEKWINEVKGFETIEGYKITDKGNVISYKRKKIKQLNPYPNTKGYPLVDLSQNRRSVKVHRLVAIAFIPNPKNKPQVNHINGIKTDNRVENLEWVTNSENQLHAIKIGLKRSLSKEDNYQYNKPSASGKPVAQLNEGREIIGTYHSLAHAARSVGLKAYGSIARACKNPVYKAAGSYWEFIDR